MFAVRLPDTKTTSTLVSFLTLSKFLMWNIIYDTCPKTHQIDGLERSKAQNTKQILSFFVGCSLTDRRVCLNITCPIYMAMDIC